MAFRELRGRSRRRAAGRGRASRWTSSSGCSRRACARSSSTRIPDHQNPAGVSLSAERRARARRARAPVRLPDRRGRRLPRARLRRRGAAEPLEPRAGRRRPGWARRRRRSSPGSGSAGRSGPAEVVAQLVGREAEHRPVRGRARPAAVRGVRAHAAAMDEQLARSRALYRRSCGRLLAALERTMPDGGTLDATAGRLLLLADAAGRRRRRRARAAAQPSAGRRRSCPGTLFFPDGRGGANRAALLQPGRRRR